jgi:hypothetical protein
LVAVAFGKASVLARYLRETRPVSSGVTNLVAFMLDPEGYDADGDDQTDWCRTWRLEFRRTGRGNRKNMAEVDMRLLRIGIFIETLVTNGMKAEAAKAKAREEFVTVCRAARMVLTPGR